MTKLVIRLAVVLLVAGAAMTARHDAAALTADAGPGASAGSEPAIAPSDSLDRLFELLVAANNDENLGQKFPGSTSGPSSQGPSTPGPAEVRPDESFAGDDQLDDALRGTILEGRYPDGELFREAYVDTGKLFYVDSGGIVGGDWTIEDGAFCTTYEDGDGSCFLVRIEGSNCFLFFHTEGDGSAGADWDAIAWRQGTDDTCQSSEPPRASLGDEPPISGAFGSGFVVSADGDVITNAHVVEGCRSIEVVGLGEATIAELDGRADLALLKVAPRSVPGGAARLHAEALHLGQQVVMLGYPLSDLMGNALTVNTGIVSSLTGPGGDGGLFTLSANVQPGNSGGPVLDMKGRVVGVAVAKLDEVSLLENAGTTGGAIGFAVTARSLAEFLGPKHDAGVAGDTVDDLDVETVAAQAQDFTAQVICHQ